LGRAAGFEFLHVPYQGAAPALQDLLGGQIAATLTTSPAALPQSRSRARTVRPLVTTGPHRNSYLPDVPTVREAGYPTLEYVDWFGVFVPVKTPVDIVNKLNREIREALRTKGVHSGYANLSLISPEARQATLRNWSNSIPSGGHKSCRHPVLGPKIERAYRWAKSHSRHRTHGLSPLLPRRRTAVREPKGRGTP